MRITTSKRARPLLAYAVLLAFAAIAIVISGIARPSPAKATFDDYYVEDGDIDLRYPAHEELADWVSFADQLSVVRVLSRIEIDPVPPGPIADHYPFGPPMVEVEETVWRRDQAPELNVGEWLELPGGEWGTIGRDRRAAVTDGFVNMEVGQRYLVPLMRTVDVQTGEETWRTLPYSPLPLDGELIVRPDTSLEVLWPAVETMIGKTIDEAADTLYALSRTRS
jgi:hypothetical protein